MPVTKRDLIVFVYTLAAVFSGGYLVEPGSPELTPPRIALLAAVGAAWTVYYRWVVQKRLDAVDAADAEGEGEGEAS